MCLDVEETDPTEQDAWVNELVSYITVVSNRVSAAKSRKVTIKAIEEGTLKRLFELRASGLSITAIWKEAHAEGLTTERGDRLSYYKIKDMLYNGKGQALGAAIGQNSIDPHKVLSDWITENLTATGDEKAKERVYMGDVRKAYANYCKAIVMRPLPAGDVGQAINAAFPNRKFKTMGKVAYRGLALNQ